MKVGRGQKFTFVVNLNDLPNRYWPKNELYSNSLERHEKKNLSSDQKGQKADGQSKGPEYVDEVNASQTLRNRFASSKAEGNECSDFNGSFESRGQTVLSTLASSALHDASAADDNQQDAGKGTTENYCNGEDITVYHTGKFENAGVVISPDTGLLANSAARISDKDLDASKLSAVQTDSSSPTLNYEEDSLETKPSFERKLESKSTNESSTERYVSVVKTMIGADQSPEQHAPAVNHEVHMYTVSSTDKIPETTGLIPELPEDMAQAVVKKPSILEVLGANTTQEAVLKMDTLEAVSDVMRRAGLESSNLIFGNSVSRLDV
ncbi:unnamed protein product [Soboliphyme baturini]|uniref:Ski_Sno domain-containing protein n=1 Tax=Soboliphyme baturini TaxID=241478 RepID=A0A183I9E4_9BILA|nr:unnamed protein product [Soboliphyme baturini]